MKTRDWFRVHSFTGVVTGLVLFVICWSGTFAVLSKEMDILVTPAMTSEARGELASWGTIEASVQRAYPEANAFYFQAPAYDFDNFEVAARLPSGEAVHIYVDRVSGDVVGHVSRFDLQRFFREVHYTFFLSKFGEYFITAFALTMIASLVSALVFYKRWWRRFFAWPRAKGRAFWSELHKVGGLWSVWFLAIIGATSVWYLYEHAYLDAGGPGNYVGGAVQIASPKAAPLPEPLGLDEAIELIQEDWPELDIQLVAYGWYSDHDDVVFVQGRYGSSLFRDRSNQAHIDPITGEILWRNDSGDLPPYWVVSNIADPLHFGTFGGIWSKLLYFAFGLILSGLILSGTWLHAHRLAREAGKASRHRWAGTNLAIIGTIALFCAAAYFSFGYAKNFGPIVEGERVAPTLEPGVIAVIIAWVLVTVAIIAAWAVLLWRPHLVLKGERAPSKAQAKSSEHKTRSSIAGEGISENGIE